jgi:hypothetical protein
VSKTAIRLSIALALAVDFDFPLALGLLRKHPHDILGSCERVKVVKRIPNTSVMMVVFVLRGNLFVIKNPKQLFDCPTVVAKQQRWHQREEALGLTWARGQRGGARHSGAPMLRRYAATSALL